MSFTFKKEPRETGLRSIGSPYPDTAVKYKKKLVGIIAAPSWNTDQHWRIGIAVKCETERCGWKWVYFKRHFDKEPEAREWLKINAAKILASYTLHQIED